MVVGNLLLWKNIYNELITNISLAIHESSSLENTSSHGISWETYLLNGGTKPAKEINANYMFTSSGCLC